MAIDLSKPQDVVNEAFDADEAVKKEFQNAVSQEVMAFAEAFAPAYAFFMNAFQAACTGGMQRGLVAAFMHGVLDDALTSVKLLLSGKMGPSGNVARQAVEGICMTLLTAHPGTVELGKGKEECSYWELVRDDDERAQGNRAPHQVVANFERLNLPKDSGAQLKKQVANYHAHSHAGRLAMSLRMDLRKDGKIHFGGHFDPEKEKGYKIDLAQRAQLCIWALEVMKELLDGVKKLPLDADHVAN